MKISFNNDVLQISKIETLKEKYFHRNRERSKKIFSPPHILIKEVVSKQVIPIEFIDRYLTFSNRMVGIHTPSKDRAELFKLYETLRNNNSIYTFYTACTSSEFSVSKATALYKKDIDNLPYPSENLKKLNLNKTDKILRDDTINYWLEYSSGIKKVKLFEDVTKQNLKKFGKTFCSILNSVDDSFKPLQPIETESFICVPFCLGEQPLIEVPQKENLENHLNQLLIKYKPEASLRIIRVLRLYERNVIYLIKPKQMKYWLRSVAIRDADEVFADLVEQEYQL